MKRIKLQPYLPAMVNKVENWLTLMSNNGWNVTQINGWIFTFEKSSPKLRIYFMYSGLDKHKGISYDIYRAKEKYGRKGGKLNEREANVFEVDTAKIDIGFKYVQRIRNTYYKRYYIKYVIFMIVLLLINLPNLFYSADFWPFMLLLIIFLLYGVISLLIISNDM